MKPIIPALLVCASLGAACGTSTDAMSPNTLEDTYGVSGSFNTTITTPEGSMAATVVPVTLSDGRKAQLVIPAKANPDLHRVYYRESDGVLYPVHVDDNVQRSQLVSSPSVVTRRPETSTKRKKRSWEKEALIIGGSAAGGAGIGALAGGKKGAAIGAAAGGIGGLIYDLTTRD
jgi:hypothetical protein